MVSGSNDQHVTFVSLSGALHAYTVGVLSQVKTVTTGPVPQMKSKPGCLYMHVWPLQNFFYVCCARFDHIFGGAPPAYRLAQRPVGDSCRKSVSQAFFSRWGPASPFD